MSRRSKQNQPVCGRPADRDAVRRCGGAEHHARSRHRHRRLERRAIRRGPAPRQAARRQAPLSRDAVSRTTRECRMRTCSPSAPISTPLAPVHNEVVTNQLPFPFNIRAGMWFWDALYFTRANSSPTPRNRPCGIAAPISSKVPGIAAPVIRPRPRSAATSPRKDCRVIRFKAGSRPTSPTMTSSGLAQLVHRRHRRIPQEGAQPVCRRFRAHGQRKSRIRARK